MQFEHQQIVRPGQALFDELGRQQTSVGCVAACGQRRHRLGSHPVIVRNDRPSKPIFRSAGGRSPGPARSARSALRWAKRKHSA